MKLELLQGALAVSENPGLDSTDPRFDDIVTLVQQSDFIGAANRSEAIIAEGIYDIRLIAYFLYGQFVERGLLGVRELLECLLTLLQDNWEAVGPSAKRNKLTQNSLGWLFKQLLKMFEYEEKTKADTWNAWLSSVSSEDVEVMLDVGGALRSLLMQHLEDSATPVLDVWGKLEIWLRNFQRLVYVAPVEEVEAEEAVYSEAVAEDAVQSAPTQLQDQSELVKGSYHLSLLKKKLDAFELLVNQEKFPNAALLADDINETLASFDPKLYFPELFANYSLLLAVNIGELAGYWENRESIEWQAMKDLLKVDINGFVSMNKVPSFESASNLSSGYVED